MGILRDHAPEAGRLLGPHRDPFDRMLIAQRLIAQRWIDSLSMTTLDRHSRNIRYR